MGIFISYTNWEANRKSGFLNLSWTNERKEVLQDGGLRADYGILRNSLSNASLRQISKGAIFLCNVRLIYIYIYDCISVKVSTRSQLWLVTHKTAVSLQRRVPNYESRTVSHSFCHYAKK